MPQCAFEEFSKLMKMKNQQETDSGSTNRLPQGFWNRFFWKYTMKTFSKTFHFSKYETISSFQKAVLRTFIQQKIKRDEIRKIDKMNISPGFTLIFMQQFWRQFWKNKKIFRLSRMKSIIRSNLSLRASYKRGIFYNSNWQNDTELE